MIVRRIARPLLSSIFIFGGINALRYATAHKDAAEPVIKKLAAPLGLPEDSELLVRVNGAAMVGGGVLVATGKAPRLGSLVLLGSIIPTTLTHQWWAETDPQKKQGEQVQFFKNLSLLGGLLLAAADTEGKPGLTYRAKQAKNTARREAKMAALQAKNAAH
ncbi:DoxX family protein [Janibacter cremeus]|uniref:Putative membrane protein YphA (DoxX/SURF4 family) n=1 Tax=Janibacter cremeus TaxID=1285192 RepID=A0A852VK26_9MICO|nr:DoxX family protein [Janibacter cremeus]NYF97422.1 putative membrane protein YphA (DoxX/SURF4 family) [Janibacter cremeus]